MKDFVCSAYVTLPVAQRVRSDLASSAKARRFAASGFAACTGEPLAVALRRANATAITGTEADLARQSLCFDGLIIGAACSRRRRDSTTA
jgi:hypothetical protein